MVHQLGHALVLDVVLFLKSCFSSYISLLLVSLVFWQSVYNKTFFFVFFYFVLFQIDSEDETISFLTLHVLKKIECF